MLSSFTLVRFFIDFDCISFHISFHSIYTFRRWVKIVAIFKLTKLMISYKTVQYKTIQKLPISWRKTMVVIREKIDRFSDWPFVFDPIKLCIFSKNIMRELVKMAWKYETIRSPFFPNLTHFESSLWISSFEFN